MRQLTLFSLLLLVLSSGLYSLEYIRPYIRGKKVVFSFSDPQNKVKKAYLVGSMNDWNTRTLPFQRSLDGRHFSVQVDLEPGRYEYKFLVNTFLFQDMANPLSAADGWGKANSVLYVLSNHVLDWDQEEHFLAMEDGSWQLMESYPVILEGYYTLQESTLDLGRMKIQFSPGVARLAVTEKGVTGLLYWGEAYIPGVSERTDPVNGLFLRFHPRLYHQSLSNLLRPAVQTEQHLHCNNLFYLHSWSFFHVGDDFLIPPQDFVGVSLGDADYQVTRLLAVRLDDPTLHPGTSAPGPVDSSLQQSLSEILQTWLLAVRDQEGQVLQPLVYPPIFSSIERVALHMPALKGWQWDRKEFRIEAVRQGPVSHRLEDPYYLSVPVRSARGRSGLTRLLVARLEGKWQIVNFEVNF